MLADLERRGAAAAEACARAGLDPADAVDRDAERTARAAIIVHRMIDGIQRAG